MVNKKSVKKKVSKKSPVKRTSPKKIASKKKINKQSLTKMNQKTISSKLNLSLREFGLFLVIFIITLALYSVSQKELYLNLFGTLAILSMAIVIAMVIAYLVYAILKIMKK